MWRWVVEPAVRGLTGFPLAIARIRRAPVHSLLVLVPALLAFLAVVMQVFVAYSGYLYPLRPDTFAAIGHPFTPDPEALSNAWGGPTLAGAWLVHSAVAFGIQTVCAFLLRGLFAVQDRATHRVQSTMSG